MMHMAGVNKQTDDVVGTDGVRYKVVLKPIEEKTTSAHRLHPKRSLKIVILAITAILLVALGFILYIHKNQSQTPLDTYAQQLEYPVYYPSSLPSEISFKEKSTKITGSILFFTLHFRREDIIISQQKLPNELTSFKIDGFSPVAVNIGSMLVGTTRDSPTALITTGETLITIKGSKNTNQAVITELGQKMSKLER